MTMLLEESAIATNEASLHVLFLAVSEDKSGCICGQIVYAKWRRIEK
jgi:hypothetical protein